MTQHQFLARPQHTPIRDFALRITNSERKKKQTTSIGHRCNSRQSAMHRGYDFFECRNDTLKTLHMAGLGANNGEIWVVDDDIDDQEIIKEIFKDANMAHPLVCFTNAEDMLQELSRAAVAPFMIISDINLPKINGFAMRERMLQTANNKFHGVPFLFWSSYASDAQVKKAFDLGAHGFFLKEAQFSQWKDTLLQIVHYWEKSKMPTKEDKHDPAAI